MVDKRKNTVIECANLRIKENVLSSSNIIYKLEQWQVAVESTRKKVIRLQPREFFGLFLDLESKDER